MNEYESAKRIVRLLKTHLLLLQIGIFGVVPTVIAGLYYQSFAPVGIYLGYYLMVRGYGEWVRAQLQKHENNYPDESQ